MPSCAWERWLAGPKLLQEAPDSRTGWVLLGQRWSHTSGQLQLAAAVPSARTGLTGSLLPTSRGDESIPAIGTCQPWVVVTVFASEALSLLSQGRRRCPLPRPVAPRLLLRPQAELENPRHSTTPHGPTAPPEQAAAHSSLKTFLFFSTIMA